MMPAKSTKNKPLSAKQKENNRTISGIRVLCEHAIGGMKRFKAAADLYRNRIPNLDDLFNLLCAGLWNFHIAQTASFYNHLRNALSPVYLATGLICLSFKFETTIMTYISNSLI